MNRQQKKITVTHTHTHTRVLSEHKIEWRRQQRDGRDVSDGNDNRTKKKPTAAAAAAAAAAAERKKSVANFRQNKS